MLGASLRDPAVEEVDDTVGIFGHVGLVGDHDDGDFLLAVETDQKVHDLVAGLGVDIAGRLVGEEHVGFGHDRPGDGDALLLTAGELARGVMGARFEADPRQRFHGERPALPVAHAAIDQRQLDILDRRGAGEQVEALEHEAEIMPAQQRALLAVEPPDLDAVEKVAAARRLIEAADDVHGRRLARARWAHHRHELAFADAEADAVKRAHAALAAPIDLGDVAELDQGRARE